MKHNVTVIEDFLKSTLPFSELPKEVLARAAKCCGIDFFPAQTRLLTRGETTPTDVLIIQTGAVKLFLTDEDGGETLADFRGPGAVVGVLSAIRGGPANLSAETVEDTFAFRMPVAVFREIVESQPAVAQYFLKSFSEIYVSRAFGELRRRRVLPRSESSLPLFATKVGQTVRRPPVTVEMNTDIRCAAGIMAGEGVGSLLVKDPLGAIAGIITDKDLRRKVVAQGLDYGIPVAEIMSGPVRTIPESEDCFDALLTMMKHQIHHLAVEKKGHIVGVITSHDLMVLQGRSPFGLFSEIEHERTFTGLYELSKKIPLVIRPLIEEGAKAGSVGRMIAVLGEVLLDRVLSLLQEDMGPPPSPFCWLLLGSEARREQTFRTDQDNALVYLPPDGKIPGRSPDPELKRQAGDYFLRFGRLAIEHLVNCGYPPCPAEMMASNPRWNLEESGWSDFFRRIVNAPEPEQVLHATIFFDMRPGFGYNELGERIKAEAVRLASKNEVFLGFLARDCLRARPPLTFFKGFVVEKSGEHKNHLDLKGRGIMPFVDVARLLALRAGLTECNTLDRLTEVNRRGLLSDQLYSEAAEAFEFLSQIRLVHQLRLMESGRQPDNFMNPADLSELEKRTLKEAFGLVGALQSLVREEFHVQG
ncbi:MAG: cyclic nucleotide-binding/CBS domain-containing protein [Deltaproteobacteria bacterium]|nr:cyclic nucleotide-binding/CBS domain-containing protein [Deltaproteobacteria bacterium]